MVKFRGKTYNLTVTRNMSFWHQYPSNEGHFHHLKDFGVKANLQILTITENGTHTSAFMFQPNYDEYSKAVMEAVKKEKGIKQLKRRYEKNSSALLKSLDLAKKDLSPKTLANFIDKYRCFSAGLMITATIGRTGGDLLARKLKSIHISEEKIPEIISAVTYPNEHTPLFKSQIDLLKIAARIQSRKLSNREKMKSLKGWLNNYGHIPVNFTDEPWTMEDAKAQLKNLLKQDCKLELKKLKNNHKDRVLKKDKLLKGIKNEEIKILSGAVAEATYLNEFRKNIFSKVSLEYRDLFKKIARFAGSQNWRDCFYLMPGEMANILEGKTINLSKIVKERKVVGAYVNERGEAKLLNKKVANRFYDFIKSNRGINDAEDKRLVIKGFSANGGKVTGVVKVILGTKDFHKLNPGEILVAPMTSVDFVPIMEKASAFVTDEGGITSHASIVAREMAKPCIIGTKIATKVLKDGDLVEVDANKGIVKILK